jgi:hypothetical protein
VEINSLTSRLEEIRLVEQSHLPVPSFLEHWTVGLINASLVADSASDQSNRLYAGTFHPCQE